MTRIDELTGKLLDGILTNGEWEELETQLRDDPGADSAHILLLELEGALRGLRKEFDLVEPTLAKLQEVQTENTARAVMAEIAGHESPDWASRAQAAPVGMRTSRSRKLLAVCAVAAIAAALVLGLWLGGRNPQTELVEQAPSQSLDYAKVTRLSGSVELLSPLGELRPAKEGGDVPPGHTLRTIGEDSIARVEFPDRTTVDIEPDSIVRFLSMNGDENNSRLYLASGQLTAAVPEEIADRQLVVGTGMADVFARKGTFVVSSAGPDSLRVEIKHGKVDVVGTRNPTRVPVAKGAAVMRAGFENVFLEPVVRVDRTPSRTLLIPGS
jgi:hypothetical protein